MRYLSAMLGALLLVAAAAAQEHEQQARRIEGLLMAPCCGGTTVAEHYSGSAMQMRREIRQMLAAGRTEAEILDFYVAQHGEQILAMPRARGLNVLAYALPALLLLAGVGLVVVAMRRWRGTTPAVEEPTPTDELDPEYVERLERELRAD